jgi:hypothetical protein
MGSRWGAAGPPVEAYSRLTDVARFAPLHDIGRAFLDDLERRYLVAREITFEPDRHGPDDATVVRLVPDDPTASPLAVVFDAFPGLTLRYGRTGALHLPACGCDACDEAVEDCEERLHDHADAVIAGTFGERLVHEVGAWWHEMWHRTAHSQASGRSRVEGPQLEDLQAVVDLEVQWRPWQLREAVN